MPPTKYLTTHGPTKTSLHSLVPDPQSLRPQRLKSRHPFYGHAAEHHNCDYHIIEAWNEEWTKHQRPKQLTLNLNTTAPPGFDLPWKLWVTLNRLRAGVGRFGAEMHKWGFRTLASCACGAATQNAEHILFDCNLLLPPNTVKNLTNVIDDTKNWLQHLAENLRLALKQKKTRKVSFFLSHPVAIVVGALQMTDLFFGCVHQATYLRLKRLAEPISLQAWPPVFHIKVEASRLVPCPKTQENLPACSPQPPNKRKVYVR